jgi:hypothetical protein
MSEELPNNSGRKKSNTVVINSLLLHLKEFSCTMHVLFFYVLQKPICFVPEAWNTNFKLKKLDMADIIYTWTQSIEKPFMC